MIDTILTVHIKTDKKNENVVRIVGFDDYFVSKNGNVFSSKYKKFKKLKKQVAGKGYYVVSLRKEGKTFQKYIHRLVAEAFIPNVENKLEINHKNGKKIDNCVENLEWVTKSENQKHRFYVLKKDFCGQKPVCQIKNNKIVGFFNSAAEAERCIGISKDGIRRCCKGIYLTSGGYEWKYKGVKNENKNKYIDKR